MRYEPRHSHMIQPPSVDWQLPFEPKERLYSGDSGGRVTVREGTRKKPLDARIHLHRHSETFEWGRDNVGAAQLSLALLADALEDDPRAQQLQQDFKERVVVDLPERWTITRSRILAHVRMIEALRVHAGSGRQSG